METIILNKKLLNKHLYKSYKNNYHDEYIDIKNALDKLRETYKYGENFSYDYDIHTFICI